MFALWSDEGIVSVLCERASPCSSVRYEFAIFLQVFCFSKLLGIKIKGMGYRPQYLFNTDLLGLIKISNILWQTYSFIIFWMLFLATIIFDSKIQNCHGFSDVQYFPLYLKFIMFSVNILCMNGQSQYLFTF